MVACKKAGTEALPPSERGPDAGVRVLGLDTPRLDTPSAFDLVESRDGATLLWAPEGAQPAPLMELLLDREGLPAEAPRPAIPTTPALGRFSDLRAARGGVRTTVAWVERSSGEARTRAAILRRGAAAELFDLGPAFFAPEPAQGQLAVTATEDGALVLSRGLGEPCVEAGATDCHGFGFHRVRPGLVDGRGLPLSVPKPCVQGAVHLSVLDNRWVYAICSQAVAEPRTTVFSIRYDPEYARADAVLPGCHPLGLERFQDAIWLFGDCAGVRRAVRITGDDAPMVHQVVPPGSLECPEGHPRLRSGDDEIPLGAPRSGLEVWLSAPLLPPGGRAAWSGEALLLAFVDATRRLHLERRRCPPSK